MNHLALFDCDGTLVDSAGHICAAMDASFAEAGFAPPGAPATRRVVGLSLTEAMATLLPEHAPATHAALGEGYRRAFQAMRAAGAVAEPLYEGIAPLIAALDEGGWRLGVATGKSDRGLRLCLEAHGLAHRFVTLQTADRHPSKPDPAMIRAAMAEAGAAPATTVMIGDTSYDMAMARAAGAHAIGVGWGYHDEAALIEAGAEQVVQDVTALGQALDALRDHFAGTASIEEIG